jgi:hypothetical protein
MQIIALLAISLLVIGTGYVYADERIDEQVIIPFDYNGRVCGMLDNGNFVCEWDPNRIDIQDAISNGTDIIPQPDNASSTLCPDNFELMDDNVTCMPIIIEEDIPPTYREKQLDRYEGIFERLKEIEEPTAHEREYIALLENLAECRSGYGQSKGVFEDRWFPISYTWINDGEAWLKSFDYTGLEAELHKGIEECKAIRTVLNPVILGQWYENRANADEFDRNIYHGDKASNVPIWTQERVNSQSNQQFEKNVDVCQFSGQWSDHTKRYYGCYEYPNGQLINPSRVVVYENEIEERWLQYQIDGGKAQTKELMQKVIEDKMRELRQSIEQQKRQLEALN